MTNRNIFGELLEGVAAMKNHRKGKLTLRSYKVEPAPGREEVATGSTIEHREDR
jgi:hypothetical protein